jgi:hypothetical protein
MQFNRFNLFSVVRSGVAFWVCVFLLTGCMTWKPDWPETDPAAPSPDVGALLDTADNLAGMADSRESLQASMNAYSNVLQQDPHHVRALTELATQSILMGTAYSDSRQAKRDHFRSAIRLCERAMYTNEKFKALMDEGVPPWEASQTLGEREMPAMMFWSTAVLYLFKETMSLPEKVINVAWIERTGPFLERMRAIDPEWGGGAIPFTQSLYFGILPASKGGNADLSKQYLEDAVAVGAPWMLSRWGRAKYFHLRDKDRQAFEEDLRWVVEQDVTESAEAYCWRVYFKREAENLLTHADRYF